MGENISEPIILCDIKFLVVSDTNFNLNVKLNVLLEGETENTVSEKELIERQLALLFTVSKGLEDYAHKLEANLSK